MRKEEKPTTLGQKKAANEKLLRKQLEAELKKLRTAPFNPGYSYLSEEERQRIRSSSTFNSRPDMPSIKRSHSGRLLGDL